MNSVVVFCGSSLGQDMIYEQQSRKLGAAIAGRGMTLIYGGANVGLMGALADEVLAKEGTVIGVLPTFLKEKEIAHEKITELIMVDSMHERKRKMNDLCEGAIALPGGFGTLEEFFEILTWAQLGLHRKPIGILNVNGFYDRLIDFMDGMVDQGFLKPQNRELVIVADEPDALLDLMEDYRPLPVHSKWLDREKT